MTCICSLVEDGIVYLAGDRAASNGYAGYSSGEPKVFHNGDFMFGYTTSFRMGQILEHIWSAPQLVVGKDIKKYIYVDVVNSIKQVFKDNDWKSGDTNEDCGSFIMAYGGAVYEMQPDFSLMTHPEGLVAVGSGYYHATAVIDALRCHSDLGPEDILREAVRITSKYIVSVDNVVDVIMQGEPK